MCTGSECGHSTDHFAFANNGVGTSQCSSTSDTIGTGITHIGITLHTTIIVGVTTIASSRSLYGNTHITIRFIISSSNRWVGIGFTIAVRVTVIVTVTVVIVAAGSVGMIIIITVTIIITIIIIIIIVI